jgi:hypothetical protein
MPDGKTIVKGGTKTQYQSFIDEKLPEIKNQHPSISAKEAYQIARQQWRKTKEQTPMIKKNRGRPKKIQDDSDGVKTTNGKRGRPPKNPLVKHIDKFEVFIEKSIQWNKDKSQEEMMKELQIDQETLLIFFEHLDQESELRQLLEKKNAPKKNRGRPKGSKNKNGQHETEEEVVIETPPEVIKFNRNLDTIFKEIENSS